MQIPKHEPNKKTKSDKKTRLTLADMPHVVEPVITLEVDMTGVEAELANLAHSVKSYVVNSYDAENKLQVFTGPEGSGYHPVLLAFQGETTDRIATALERIADAVAKFAGSDLPSLEFPVETD